MCLQSPARADMAQAGRNWQHPACAIARGHVPMVVCWPKSAPPPWPYFWQGGRRQGLLCKGARVFECARFERCNLVIGRQPRQPPLGHCIIRTAPTLLTASEYGQPKGQRGARCAPQSTLTRKIAPSPRVKPRQLACARARNDANI
jgi:hypothetical protein